MWDLGAFRGRVQQRIDAEVAHQRGVLAELGDDMARLVDPIASLLAGGKRFRAAFAQVGYLACGGTADEAMLSVATAMELFQAAALLHDDVMDDSATRRGNATAHRALAAEHGTNGWTGDGDRFGVSGAILAGDLCLVWTDEMVATSGLPASELARARRVFDTMRTQLMGGQFLDVLVSARGWDGLDTTARVAQARDVVRYKSAKYTIEHPLLIGAQAAGVGEADAARLSAYGLALGEAFQLRDDVLGVFGDPATTGKPAGDDLREGKRTVLLALALDGLDDAGRARMLAGLGRPDLTADDVAELRDLVRRSGAPDRHEELIAAQVAAARAELAATTGLTEPGRAALADLIDLTTARES
ncbi:MAG: polyprenyl synthetase family protein [Austwickia sp.]|jgi:geranylgeranyl diphosphate synthase type I|nr:MAG: polyprenyl synthetase family protein [Austwickia sp.]